MGLRAAVGKSTNRKPLLAGREAASAALEQLAGAPPCLVLVFATAGYDQPALLQAIRGCTGEAPLAGCSGSGVITQEGSDESSHAVAVLVLAGEGVRAHAVLAPNASRDALACGRSLAQALRAPALGDEALVLLFTDGLTTDCTQLLAGLREGPGLPCPVLGASAADAFTFDHTYQYCGVEAASDAAVAVVLAGAVSAELGVSHGCDAIGIEQTITRAEGGWVQEIDGQPAWNFFKDYLDDDTAGLDALKVAFLCLAERLPSPLHAEYGEFIIRVPLALDDTTGALFFPGGLKPGTRVHVALRRAEHICAKAVETAQRIRARRNLAEPVLMLQFDCVGRGQLLFSDRATEALIDPVQRLFGKALPWLGVHTYGEIAPIGQEAYYHNFTVALCALYSTARTEG
jgi:hypothetical protein